MKRITVVFQELIGLFVEDGSLAIAIVVWICAAALLFLRLPGGAAWRAPALFLGFVLILLENVVRSARKR
jgi:uncharacterized membrane protein YtjA (UPF0391 family)